MTTLSQPHRQAPLFALWHWAKKNLFSSIPNSLLTLLCFWLLWHISSTAIELDAATGELGR